MNATSCYETSIYKPSFVSLIPNFNVSFRIEVLWQRFRRSGIRKGMQRLLGRWFRNWESKLLRHPTLFSIMNIKEMYLYVIGHNTLLIFVIWYRGLRRFIFFIPLHVSQDYGQYLISDFIFVISKKKKIKILTK